MNVQITHHLSYCILWAIYLNYLYDYYYQLSSGITTYQGDLFFSTAISQLTRIRSFSHNGAQVQLVFEGPVLGPQKDQGPDCSPGPTLVLSGPVLVLKILWDVKDRF